MFVRDNFEYESGGISNHLILQKTEAGFSQIARREVDDAAEINKLLNGLKARIINVLIYSEKERER